MRKSHFFHHLSGNTQQLRRLPLVDFSYRQATTVVIPISAPNTSLIAEYGSLLLDYRTKRSEYTSLLKNELKSGISKCTNHDYMSSLIHFDRVIALAAGEAVSTLSMDEKKLIALAYAYKARILSHGSSEDVKMALAHLDIALELDPTQKIAIECRNSIQSEVNLNYDSDAHDAELGLLTRKT